MGLTMNEEQAVTKQLALEYKRATKKNQCSVCTDLLPSSRVYHSFYTPLHKRRQATLAYSSAVGHCRHHRLLFALRKEEWRTLPVAGEAG